MSILSTNTGIKGRDGALALSSSSHVFRDLAMAALLGAAVLVALTFTDYGITNDEEVQNVYGHKLLAFYTTWFQDRSAFDYIDLFRYGGLFDLTAAILNQVSPFGEYETRHLLGGLIGVVGLAGAWKLGRLLGGERAGFLALVLLALTPAFYGHSFNNPKDAPFASGMVWTLYYVCRAMAELPLPRWRIVVKLGIALGLTLSIRVGAVLVIFYVGLGVMVYLLTRWRAGAPPREVARLAWTSTKRLSPALFITYGLMAVFWPWAVMSPLNPVRALLDFSRLPINIDTLVDGEWVKATAVPPDYLPDYLLVNLPELVLLGLAMALGFAAGWAWRQAWRWQKGRKPLQFLLVTVAAIFPVVFFMLTRPTAYNGMRHFLFVVPPMAVLAGIAIDRMWRLLARRGRLFDQLCGGGLTVALVAQIWVMAQLHPDEYVYYNMLTGGVKGAEGAYELDYWGNSLLEATRELANFIEMENGDKPVTQPVKVAVCGHRLSAAYFFPPYMIFTKKLEEADFLIAFTQANCHRKFKGTQIIAVERFGVALSVVKDRRALIQPPNS